MDDLLKIIRQLEALKNQLDRQSIVIGSVISQLKELLPVTGISVQPKGN